MQHDTVLIREVTPSDLRKISEIHGEAFPGFLMTLLGPRFLQIYYRTVLDYSGGIFLIATIDKNLAGFVAGFQNPAGFYQLFNDRKRRAMLAAMLYVIVRPSIWGRVFKNMRHVSGQAGADPSPMTGEIASIAVDPAVSRAGCGSLLVDAFMTRAHQMGLQEVILTTDTSGNDAVNAFYAKNGFVCVAQVDRIGGRPMNHYVNRLVQ